ncbi:hypothetical protein [Lihuaxuella thermophila]|nr:hypothetical protein [Lihuaxuella thermophila]
MRKRPIKTSWRDHGLLAAAIAMIGVINGLVVSMLLLLVFEFYQQ